MTTSGNPIADNQNCITAGPRGLLLMQDYQLLDKLVHQNRERTVHARGSAACGVLTITREIAQRSRPGVVKSKNLAVRS